MSKDEQSVLENGIDILGPNSSHIKLISGDDCTFFLERKNAMLSGTIKAMLSGPREVAQDEPNIIQFKEISSQVMKQICLYLIYKGENINNTNEVPEFYIPPAMIVDLLMAANILDC